jgi:hypothetical protein
VLVHQQQGLLFYLLAAGMVVDDVLLFSICVYLRVSHPFEHTAVYMLLIIAILPAAAVTDE